MSVRVRVRVRVPVLPILVSVDVRLDAQLVSVLACSKQPFPPSLGSMTFHCTKHSLDSSFRSNVIFFELLTADEDTNSTFPVCRM